MRLQLSTLKKCSHDTLLMVLFFRKYEENIYAKVNRNKKVCSFSEEKSTIFFLMIFLCANTQKMEFNSSNNSVICSTFWTIRCNFSLHSNLLFYICVIVGTLTKQQQHCFTRILCYVFVNVH